MSHYHDNMKNAIEKALKKGLSVSESTYKTIHDKIKNNDINFLKINNIKYYFTEINEIVYYCTYSIKTDRIMNFFNKESFFKDENNQWKYKKISKLNKVQIRRKKHAIERAMERYGLLITDQIYDKLITFIKDDKAIELMKDKSKNDEFFYFYKVNYLNEDYIALYSKKTSSIISFYHKNWIIQDDNGQWIKAPSNKNKKIKRKIQNRKSHKFKSKKNKKTYNRKKEKY
jgi:hypothetical protein